MKNSGKTLKIQLFDKKHKYALIFLLVLLVTLPILIWAILTQQFDPRRRAQEDPDWCLGDQCNDSNPCLCSGASQCATDPVATNYTTCQPSNIGEEPSSTPTPYCIDSDSGLNYPKRGTVTNDTCQPQTDFCNGNVLQEQHCGIQYQCLTTAYTCPNGCSEGACNDSTASSHTITIKVKLTGVIDRSAQGTRMSVQFLNNNFNRIVQPIPELTYLSDGVYETNFIVTEDELPQRDGYRVIVKGERHIGKKLCRKSGQTAPCALSDSIQIVYSEDPFVLDFTGRPLDPGDIAPQDGKVDRADYDKILTQSARPSGTDDAAYRAADLNYSGNVNVLDVYWLRNTLSTRDDEN